MGIATIELMPPPRSVNAGPSHRRVQHRRKKAIENDLAILLLAANVPRPIPGDRVRATAELLFPVARRRDEDNYRAGLSKALGDALCPHDPESPFRWLTDDTPAHFTFGTITFGQTALDSQGKRRPAVAIVRLVWGDDLAAELQAELDALRVA